MRVLGKNMAWLLNCIEQSKQNGLKTPELGEDRVYTNFIDNPENFRNSEDI